MRRRLVYCAMRGDFGYSSQLRPAGGRGAGPEFDKTAALMLTAFARALSTAFRSASSPLPIGRVVTRDSNLF